MVGSRGRSYVQRKEWLEKMKNAGYNGILSVTEYYACEKWQISNGEITYLGRFRYRDNGFMKQNLLREYSRVRREYVKQHGVQAWNSLGRKEKTYGKIN